MKFWESSAIVPLLLPEPTTPHLESLLAEDGDVVVWWGTVLESESALRRRERESPSLGDVVAGARTRRERWRRAWTEILPSAGLRASAMRLLAVHPLRSLDALQLAAALEASAPDRSSLPFVCLDRRLADAASREGLDVVTVP